MNDLCSRFLEVLDSEVDTFWSFSCYMEKFSKDFRADGLHRKIGEVAKSRYTFFYILGTSSDQTRNTLCDAVECYFKQKDVYSVMVQTALFTI